MTLQLNKQNLLYIYKQHWTGIETKCQDHQFILPERQISAKEKLSKKQQKLQLQRQKYVGPKKKGKIIKRRGRKNTRRGGSAMSKMLQPFLDADQAAKCWIAHMNDPWNYPPVSLGRTSGATGIARSFATQLTSANVAYDAVLMGIKPCGFDTANNFNAGYYSLGNSNWASGGLANLNWANYAYIANVANGYRPISMSARMSFRYPSTINPPYLFGGLLPIGALSDTNLIGGTSGAVTNANIVYQTPSTIKLGGNSIQVCWNPEDFSDISSFNTNWGLGPVSAPITSLPYFGAVGLSSGNWTCEVEYISFFQYQQNYADVVYTVTADDSINYSCSELWDRYLVHKNKLVNIKKPKWTSMHATKTAHLSGKSAPIMFAERPGNTENKNADHEVEYKGSNLDDEVPVTRNHDVAVNHNKPPTIYEKASSFYDTVAGLAAEWGPQVYGIYRTFKRYHDGARGIMMLHTDLKDGIHNHILNKEDEKKEQKTQSVFDKKLWLDNLPPVKITPREVGFIDPAVLGGDNKLRVPRKYIDRLVEKDLALSDGRLRIKNACDHLDYMDTIKEVDGESDVDSFNHVDISESVNDLLEQQIIISQQLSAKMQRNADVETK